MKVLITGSLGLIGSEAVRFYLNEACEVHGVDNDMRKHFFGPEASVIRNKIDHPNYHHYGVDISKIEGLIELENPDVIIHAAAQPSARHAPKNQLQDFGINAFSTLMLLEMTRKHCPDSVFIYLSSRPNFHISKLVGDLYTQDYARLYGLKTGIFRLSAITGENQCGVEEDGFLSHMVRCKKLGRTFKVFGDGTQTRDIMHVKDLMTAIDCFVKNPKCGAIYEMGGGEKRKISLLEALNWIKLENYEFSEEEKFNDPQEYASDVSGFKKDYPEWDYKYNLWAIFEDLMR